VVFVVAGEGEGVVVRDVLAEESEVSVIGGDGRPISSSKVNNSDGAGEEDVEATVFRAGRLPVSCSYFINAPKMLVLYPSLS
jgi:hypothetical protein